jgi:hypothetical protein
MSRTHRTLAIGAAALSVGLGAGAGLVAAHTSNSPSEAGISTTSFGMTGAIVGLVASDNIRCQEDRKLQFLRERNGKDKLLGAENADVEGRAYHEALEGLEEAGYYVRAKRSVLKKTAQHTHTCGKARSGTVTFGMPPPGP